MNLNIYNNNTEYLLSEFENIFWLLGKYIECKDKNNFEDFSENILKQYHDKRSFLKKSLKESAKYKFFCSRYIRKIYKFTNLEWFCVLVCIMFDIDTKYKTEILKIEDSNSLTYSAILKLYYFTPDILKIKNYYEILSELSKKMSCLCFLKNEVKLDSRIFENIISNATEKLSIPGIYVNFASDYYNNALIIREKIATQIYNYIQKAKNSTCFFISGESGIGKKTILNRVFKLCDKPTIFIDIDKVKGKNFENNVLIGCREALFLRGYICICGIEKLKEEKEFYLNTILRLASRFSKFMFVISQELDTIKDNIENLDFININLPKLSLEESYQIWSNALNSVKLDKNLNISELSSKYMLSCGQIKKSVYDSIIKANFENKDKIDENILSNCIYNQLETDLKEKATIIKNKHTWNQLILNQKEKDIIKMACNQMKIRRIVYDKWEMNKRILYGTGLSMLFAGAPGTGKTMAAQVVANELGLEIYKVDLSKVISKYIGESEKNLCEIFDSAKKSNVILLFDETDAIFTKRTEVKDSHDRNANLETSYLLQKMEEHSGITILTTNYLENIDKAFFRRINYVVHFAFPNENSRKKIWENIFTKKVPISKDIDFDFIAKHFELSGGSIKNAALTAAFMAASENKKVSMKYIIKSLEHELKKQGKMVSKDDFGEYGYLI